MYDFVFAFRHGINEQKALRKLQSHLRQSSGGPQSNLDRVKPLIEIVDSDDLNNVRSYTSRYDEVFVDFPRYLLDRDNKYQDGVSALANTYSKDPVEFHRDNADLNYTPVISGTLDPIDYSNFMSYIRDLSDEFAKLCIRLFVPVGELSQSEEDELSRIVSELRPEDAVLADVPDVRELSSGVRPNIEFLSHEITRQDFYLFDLFEPRDGVNYNYGLVMGKHADVDGVGDLAIEPRFPEDIPAAAFQNIPSRVHSYESPSHSISVTEDSDYYVNAVETMDQNGDLDPDHCPACEELHDEYQHVQNSQDRTDLGAGFVKQMRMTHYAHSLLSDEFPEMASATDAQDFDQQGYEEIS